MLPRAHQLKHGEPSLSMGARPEEHAGEHGAQMAPAQMGFEKGRAGGLPARRGCFLGVAGRGRKGRERTEKSRQV